MNDRTPFDVILSHAAGRFPCHPEAPQGPKDRVAWQRGRPADGNEILRRADARLRMTFKADVIASEARAARRAWRSCRLIEMWGTRSARACRRARRDCVPPRVGERGVGSDGPPAADRRGTPRNAKAPAPHRSSGAAGLLRGARGAPRNDTEFRSRRERAAKSAFWPPGRRQATIPRLCSTGQALERTQCAQRPDNTVSGPAAGRSGRFRLTSWKETP
jgi:hypothetical protein